MGPFTAEMITIFFFSRHATFTFTQAKVELAVKSCYIYAQKQLSAV